MNFGDVKALAFDFSSNDIAGKTPAELGRYIAGIGDVSPTFFSFVIAVKSYDDAEKRECFDAFSKAAALYEENF
ncbi:hypothetical protein [uncultured Sulfitobacter sp.]|uniref:hypothetical protein n=1 Tax=uncultured Sulfitobacter sp. TaxID=191468 RepID=UPI00259AD715|nr:hypothetical protein [uncultured Sulfitobacter sp.]